MTVTIGVDAGHGGRNIGTHDDDLVEKNVTLDIDRRLGLALLTAPFNVARTRLADIDVTQKARGYATLAMGCSFVASLHVNYNDDPTAQGAQLYHGGGNRVSKLLCCEFAPLMDHIFGKCSIFETNRTHGKWIEEPRAIINAHVADVVLFELGFRSNSKDRSLLLDHYGIELVVSALRQCMCVAANHYRRLK